MANTFEMRKNCDRKKVEPNARREREREGEREWEMFYFNVSNHICVDLNRINGAVIDDWPRKHKSLQQQQQKIHTEILTPPFEMGEKHEGATAI